MFSIRLKVALRDILELSGQSAAISLLGLINEDIIKEGSDLSYYTT